MLTSGQYDDGKDIERDEEAEKLDKHLESEENVPCIKCGRTDLPLHTNRQCADCGPWTEKDRDENNLPPAR